MNYKESVMKVRSTVNDKTTPLPKNFGREFIVFTSEENKGKEVISIETGQIHSHKILFEGKNYYHLQNNASIKNGDFVLKSEYRLNK